MDRPSGQLRSIVAANFGRVAFAAVCARRTVARRTHAVPTRARSGRDIGVIAVNAVVDVVVGIRPKVVIGIRPVNVVEQVVIGVWPEQWSNPADDETAAPPRPAGTEEPAVESRLPELRSQGHVGDGAVAEHPATRIARACRGTPERVGRCVGEPVARAADARPADMCRTPGETAASD